jgi:hypothetical protein
VQSKGQISSTHGAFAWLPLAWIRLTWRSNAQAAVELASVVESEMASEAAVDAAVEVIRGS